VHGVLRPFDDQTQTLTPHLSHRVTGVSLAFLSA